MPEKAEVDARDWCGAAIEHWLSDTGGTVDVSRETSKSLAARSDVSRETIARIEDWLDALVRWNRGVQLVGRQELKRLWRRHVADSFGLLPFIRDDQTWVDLGSGGGFPVVPLAIAARASGLNTRFVAIESDKRKAAFLSMSAAGLQPGFDVRSGRIEDQRDLVADIVSARALASVDTLGELSAPILAQRGVLLFLKGPSLHQELTRAGHLCHINHKILGHPWADNSYILIIKGLEHVERSGDGGEP